MKYKILHLLALLWLSDNTSAAPPYTFSADGQEISDSKTRLIWKRCVEGMSFDGVTCTGTPMIFFSHEVALAYVRDVSINLGIRWRLPNIKELHSITDTTRFAPAIDIAAFPGTPGSYHLSSSPLVGTPDRVWLVNFYLGSTEPFYRIHSYTFASYNLRLVRSIQ